MRNLRALHLQEDIAARTAARERAREHSGMDARIEKLSMQVRTIYCASYRELSHNPAYGTRRMPNWDGGVDHLGRSHGSVWLKIAKQVAILGADPVEYIRAQFSGATAAAIPKPNCMYNDQAVSNWRNYHQIAKERLQFRVRSDINQVHIHLLPLTCNLKWETRKAYDYVLRNKHCTASPLIRYCVAVANELPIAGEFREAALLQYVFQMPGYDELLGERIPEELRQESQVLYSRLAQ